MARKEDNLHSILIVSSSEQFDATLRKSLTDFLMIDSKRNAAAARRSFLERYYDLVVINAPLPDESGEPFALDVAQQCPASVLLIVPSEVYEDVLEHVTDQGILVISKPLPHGRLDKAIRYLKAVQGRVHNLEKKIQALEEKREEDRLVNRAKLLMVEKKHMTEDEAHRLIGKLAMNAGISRKRAAERVLEELEG